MRWRGDGKPMKYAVSFVIPHDGGDRFLIVKRPEDDEDLPGYWGLPASSVTQGETYTDAVERAGKEKLGVTLEVTGFVGRGNIERDSYLLHMELFETGIMVGTPRVPQNGDGTQYVEWRWGATTDLEEAARHGSLCCNLYLAIHSDGEPAPLF